MVTYRLASGEIFSFSIYTSVVIDVGLELYRSTRGEKGGLVIRIGSKREQLGPTERYGNSLCG